LKFVVQQHHIGGAVHWDLMLQRPGANTDPQTRGLATWQLPFPPILINLARPVIVKPLADHRLAYLSYTGPISRDRGWCCVFDEGHYRQFLYSEDVWLVDFAGNYLRGTFWLKKAAETDMWILAKSCPLG